MAVRIKAVKEWVESPREVAETIKREAMTVGDLISELQQYPEDTPVVAVSDYGDIGHTQQIEFFRYVNEFSMKEFHSSAYSNSGIALNKDDGGGDGDEERDGEEEFDYSSVVVLTSR